MYVCGYVCMWICMWIYNMIYIIYIIYIYIYIYICKFVTFLSHFVPMLLFHYPISSNKRHRRILNFETVRCGTY